jgi:hypothetical protein
MPAGIRIERRGLSPSFFLLGPRSDSWLAATLLAERQDCCLDEFALGTRLKPNSRKAPGAEARITSMEGVLLMAAQGACSNRGHRSGSRALKSRFEQKGSQVTQGSTLTIGPSLQVFVRGERQRDRDPARRAKRGLHR